MQQLFSKFAFQFCLVLNCSYLYVPCRRDGSGSRGHSGGRNKNMSASSYEDTDKCPKQKDRCSQRDYSGDTKDRKEKKKKKLVYTFLCV